MTIKNVTNKKVRGMLARQYILNVSGDRNHPMYTASDVEFAKMLDVTRLTVINIRNNINFKNRNSRFLELLLSVDTREYTIKELADKLHSKYQNTYQLIKKMNLITKPDRRPIEAMIEFQRKKTFKKHVA